MSFNLYEAYSQPHHVRCGVYTPPVSNTELVNAFPLYFGPIRLAPIIACTVAPRDHYDHVHAAFNDVQLLRLEMWLQLPDGGLQMITWFDIQSTKDNLIVTSVEDCDDYSDPYTQIERMVIERIESAVHRHYYVPSDEDSACGMEELACAVEGWLPPMGATQLCFRGSDLESVPNAEASAETYGMPREDHFLRPEDEWKPCRALGMNVSPVAWALNTMIPCIAYKYKMTLCMTHALYLVYVNARIPQIIPAFVFPSVTRYGKPKQPYELEMMAHTLQSSPKRINDSKRYNPSLIVPVSQRNGDDMRGCVLKVYALQDYLDMMDRAQSSMELPEDPIVVDFENYHEQRTNLCKGWMVFALLYTGLTGQFAWNTAEGVEDGPIHQALSGIKSAYTEDSDPMRPVLLEACAVRECKRFVDGKIVTKATMFNNRPAYSQEHEMLFVSGIHVTDMCREDTMDERRARDNHGLTMAALAVECQRDKGVQIIFAIQKYYNALHKKKRDDAPRNIPRYMVVQKRSGAENDPDVIHQIHRECGTLSPNGTITVIPLNNQDVDIDGTTAALPYDIFGDAPAVTQKSCLDSLDHMLHTERQIMDAKRAESVVNWNESKKAAAAPPTQLRKEAAVRRIKAKWDHRNRYQPYYK